MKDMNSLMDAKPSINSAAKTAAVTGSGVDLAGYDGAEIFVPVGAWSDGSFPLALMESDDNSTYSAVAAADLIGAQPTVSGVSNYAYKYGYRGTKRYIRADTAYAQGAGSTGAVFGALIVRGFKRHMPVS